MPQLTSVILTDGATPPVNHTFAPRGIDPTSGIATLVKSTGVPVGDERLTVGRSRTPQGREKVSIKMTIPVVATETTNGVDRPTVVRSAYADITLSFDGTSSLDERKNVRLMLADLMGNSEGLVLSLIDNLEYLY